MIVGSSWILCAATSILPHFCGVRGEYRLLDKIKDLEMTDSDLRSILIAAHGTRFIDIDGKKEPLQKVELSLKSAKTTGGAICVYECVL